MWHIRTARHQPSRTDDWTRVWVWADCWEERQHRQLRIPRNYCATQTKFSGDTIFGEDRKVNSIAENCERSQCNSQRTLLCQLSHSSTPCADFLRIFFWLSRNQTQVECASYAINNKRSVCEISSNRRQRRSAVCLDKKQCSQLLYVPQATLQALQQKCIISLYVMNAWTCGTPDQPASRRIKTLESGADVEMKFDEKTNRFSLQLKIHGRCGRAQVSPSKMQRFCVFEHWTYGRDWMMIQIHLNYLLPMQERSFIPPQLNVKCFEMWISS